MIKALLKALLGFIPGQYRILAAGGGVLTLLAGAGGVVWWIDHQGYQRATQEWTIKYERREAELERQRMAELDRQATANAAAKAEEEAQIELYRQQLLVTADLAQQLAAEAAQDKNAGNVALDAAAVDRHNRRILP